MKQKPIRIFCIRKQWWQIALTACLAAAMFLVVANPPFVETSVSPRQLPVYSVDRGSQKMISISFDAAWGNVRMRPSHSCGLLIQVLDIRRTVQYERSFLYPKPSRDVPATIVAIFNALHSSSCCSVGRTRKKCVNTSIDMWDHDKFSG